MKNWDLAIIHRETISSIIIKKRKVKFSRQANHVGKRSAKLNHKGYLSSASQFFITVYSHHCTWWKLVEVRFLFLSYLSLHSQFWLSASHCCCPVQEKGKHWDSLPGGGGIWVMCRVQPRKEATFQRGCWRPRRCREVETTWLWHRNCWLE